ncbi:hypothetical protein L228DRAFT_248575 [Xylona heveae TC161]|uniref:RecQ-mediated genome instability protein 1 n=1 Tax=Xylona heveae (strain CBS 132557 / TC161) TaxID=1328760 RepID=A0A165G7D2_XYLHT|nr:hypothetical protein L228DRAFT_248575 [Xylona heveae TC161]KZF21823.1 hypothetical protein L228DRAFT_248575 [Xylona heveae TC161]
MATASPIATQISTHLSTTKHMIPSTNWLASFISSQRPTTPLAALKQTALFRLLASDITQSLSKDNSATLFPPDIHNAQIQERNLAGPIAVQVLDIEDMGRSRWSQVEALEAAERGEYMKGREIIRVIPGEVELEGGDAGGGLDENISAREPSDVNGSGGRGGASATDGAVLKSRGPHKLLLQDARGVRVYGIELKSIDGVGIGMGIGTKMVLRDVVVARGTVLLGPKQVMLLGGKVDAWHKAWKEKRKERLLAAIAAEEEGR